MQIKGFKEYFFEQLAKFTPEEREIFDRIYQVWETNGELIPPKEMYSWIESTFGDIEAVKKQSFLKITNKITYEGAIFNELRTMRPVVGDTNFAEVIEEIHSSKNSPFSKPLTGTPEDVFGRIKGEYCITASNIAKYDGLHGLVVFDDHDPLLFSRKRVKDYLNVATRWFLQANKVNPKAIYPLFTWNCLWKAGSSIIHGHAQLALTEGQAYSKVEALRHHALKYQEQYRSNYFDDEFTIHEKLGLAMKIGNERIIVKITPIKDKELLILSDGFDTDLAFTISDLLTSLKETLGVVSFNLASILPPTRKTPEIWDHVPVVTRIVDRGKLTSKTADIGAMELYGQSVIETSPYTVFSKLQNSLTK